MFIGHFAVGMAAKRVAPRASLPLLLAAPLFLDILWPIFNLAGLERTHLQPGVTAASPLVLEYMPYSHSLVASLAWSVAFAAVYAAVARDRRGAIVLGALVFSHWILDLVSHSPDMPIWSGDGPRYGLGLWYSVPATIVVEQVMFLVGAWLYATATRARDRTGRVGLGVFVGALAAMQLGAVLGPAPPSPNVVFAMLFASFGLFGVAWWIERHREAVS